MEEGRFKRENRWRERREGTKEGKESTTRKMKEEA